MPRSGLPSREKLPNYLRSCRKRTGLSQEEISFLLGCRGGAKLSRYERFLRTPNLETALACERVFQTPARKLFAGVHERVERGVSKRAKRLARILARRHHDPRLVQKLSSLQIIVESYSDDIHYEPLDDR